MNAVPTLPVKPPMLNVLLKTDQSYNKLMNSSAPSRKFYYVWIQMFWVIEYHRSYIILYHSYLIFSANPNTSSNSNKTREWWSWSKPMTLPRPANTNPTYVHLWGMLVVHSDKRLTRRNKLELIKLLFMDDMHMKQDLRKVYESSIVLSYVKYWQSKHFVSFLL